MDWNSTCVEKWSISMVRQMTLFFVKKSSKTWNLFQNSLRPIRCAEINRRGCAEIPSRIRFIRHMEYGNQSNRMRSQSSNCYPRPTTGFAFFIFIQMIVRSFIRLLSAPDGCLQYFHQTTGVVESFNFGNNYLGNTHYAICFNRNYNENAILE